MFVGSFIVNFALATVAKKGNRNIGYFSLGICMACYVQPCDVTMEGGLRRLRPTNITCFSKLNGTPLSKSLDPLLSEYC